MRSTETRVADPTDEEVSLAMEIQETLRGLRENSNEKLLEEDEPSDPSPDITLKILSIRSTTLAEMEEARIAKEKGVAEGYCVDCGEKIAAKRLEAIPWATRCLTCKLKQTGAEH